MRRRTVLKRLDVVLEGLHRHALFSNLLFEQLGLMHALRSGADLLAADEEVVGVGVARVLGVGHGVEGARRRRVAVQNVKVGAVLFRDELAEPQFVRARQVSKDIGLFARILEHLHAFVPVQDARLVGEAHGRRRVLLTNHRKLPPKPLLHPRKNVLKHVVQHHQSLVVMLGDGHLQIEPREFTQVPPRVGLFRAKNWADLEYAVEIRRNGHLLVELRGLS
mmetsp:Transcript_57470/g.84309  ORF Transcript_57470/g.84309 Transcript_57470/m.84309 type:complete len:221 (+) Transcript_57470:344-1006(+)